MTVRTADARKNPHLIVKDPKGNITKVINVGDLQVGFKGDEATLILTGGLEITSKIVTLAASNATYSLGTEDIVVCVSAPTIQTTLKLPTTPDSGKLYVVKDIAGTANTYPIQLVPASGVLIDGSASTTINDNYGSFIIIWNGTGWVTVARGGSGGIYAPSNASFLTVNHEAGLTNSRKLQSNTGTITLTDQGANVDLTIDLTTTGVAPGTYTSATVTVDAYGRVTSISNNSLPSSNASYITVTNEATLTGERALVNGTGVGLTDNGANSNIVLFIKDNVFAALSGAQFSGPVKASNGLTGSLQEISQGFPYLLSGGPIKITTSSIGQVTISSSAVPDAAYALISPNSAVPNGRTLTAGAGVTFTDSGPGGTLTITSTGGGGAGSAIWIDGGGASYTTSSISIDKNGQFASTYGTDIFFFVSGSKNTSSGPDRHVAVFAGDVLVSGSLTGSIQQISNGVSYLVAGNNVTITSQSNGQIVISSVTGSGGSNATQTWIDGGNKLETTASVSIDSNGRYTNQLGTDVFFFVSGSTKNQDKTSVFGGNVRVSGTLFGELGFSGSLTNLLSGQSYLVAGNNVTISSQSNGQIVINSLTSSVGRWTDGRNRLYTTASVSVDSNARFADQLGTDVFFFVSGTSATSSPTGAKVALFGGDVHSSGSTISELGFSGSLTTLVNGTSYLVAGSNVTITSQSNGQVIINSTVTAATSSRKTPIDSNTYLYWALDETSSPFPNSGSAGTSFMSLAATGSVTAGRTGIFGTGCAFPGAGAGIYLSTGNTSVEPSLTGSTVSLWAYIRGYTNNGTMFSKTYRNNATWTTPFSSIYIALGTSGDGTWLPGFTTTGAVFTQPTINGINRLPLQQWCLIAFTYDGTAAKWYLNGNLVQTSVLTSSLDFGTHGPYEIGGLVGATQPFDGVIDDIRVENVVRSQGYFRDMYKRGMNLTDP